MGKAGRLGHGSAGSTQCGSPLPAPKAAEDWGKGCSHLEQVELAWGLSASADGGRNLGKDSHFNPGQGLGLGTIPGWTSGRWKVRLDSRTELPGDELRLPESLGSDENMRASEGLYPKERSQRLPAPIRKQGQLRSHLVCAPAECWAYMPRLGGAKY